VAICVKDWFDREVARGWWEGSPQIWPLLETHVITPIGQMQMADVTRQILIEHVIDPIVERGTIETAKRTADRLKWFFEDAVVREIIAADPSHLLRKVIPKNTKKRRQPAIVDLDEARAMLRKVEG
jgi:hypothetical protein